MAICNSGLPFLIQGRESRDLTEDDLDFSKQRVLRCWSELREVCSAEEELCSTVMEVMLKGCLLVFVVSHFLLLNVVLSDESENAEKEANEKWKKKDVRDYTEADIERLYEQWEVTCQAQVQC